MTKPNITDKAILVVDKTILIAGKAIDLLNDQIENNNKLWEGIKARDQQIRDLEMKLEVLDTEFEETLKELDAYKNEVDDKYSYTIKN